jgi:MarR family transcriptional regulator, transcriptional regulator for hemolysin
MSRNDVDEVMRAYPQIYLACHIDHRTRGTSAAGITSREASFLTHIGDEGASPAALARHIGIRPSTLSAALAALERRGLVRVERDGSDGRRRRVHLTEAGRAAIAEDSVLDQARVAALLERLDPAERTRAVEGLRLLAEAARRLRDGGQG